MTRGVPTAPLTKRELDALFEAVLAFEAHYLDELSGQYDRIDRATSARRRRTALALDRVLDKFGLRGQA